MNLETKLIEILYFTDDFCKEFYINNDESQGEARRFMIKDKRKKINGESIFLLGSKGKWKPKQLEFPISIMSDPKGKYPYGFIT